jgi:hypothetical protein
MEMDNWEEIYPHRSAQLPTPPTPRREQLAKTITTAFSPPQLVLQEPRWKGEKTKWLTETKEAGERKSNLKRDGHRWSFVLSGVRFIEIRSFRYIAQGSFRAALVACSSTKRSKTNSTKATLYPDPPLAYAVRWQVDTTWRFDPTTRDDFVSACRQI